MPTENNVAAQAGDEPMREAFEATCKGKIYRSSWNDGSDYAVGHVELAWKAFKAGAEFAAQVSSRATADVERDAKHFGLFLRMLDKAHVKFSKGADNSINRVDFTVMVGNETTETFRGKVRELFDQLAAIATTKPGA